MKKLLVVFLLCPIMVLGQIGQDYTFGTNYAIVQSELDTRSVFNLIPTAANLTVTFPAPTTVTATKTLKIQNKGTFKVKVMPFNVDLEPGLGTNYPMIIIDWKNPGWSITAAPSSSQPQSANTAFLGPASGSAAAASFRTLVVNDIPVLPYATPSDLSTGLATKEPTVPVGTTGQYYRGDKTWQTLPSIPAAQVSSDWNSVVSPTQILNKPVIPTNTNQLTNGAGFLIAEVDGSVTNEIELPAQASQSGKFLQTNGTTPSWQPALTAEVDGSVTNEIELPAQTGQASKFLQTNGTVASWQNTTTSVSAPSTGNTFTSGVAFQPSAGTSSFVSAQGTLSGLVGTTGTLVIAVSATQNGTYTPISTTRYLISVVGVTSDQDTGAIPVSLGHWVRITLTGGVTATYTKWIL